VALEYDDEWKTRCPTCGATWVHRHYYPNSIPITDSLSRDEYGNYWTWKPYYEKEES
jgi:hypothetical protein